MVLGILSLYGFIQSEQGVVFPMLFPLASIFQSLGCGVVSRIGRFNRVWLLIGCSVLSSLAFADVDKSSERLQRFAGLPDVAHMKISPSGNRYAWVSTDGDERSVVVYDVAKEKLIAGAGFDQNNKVRSVRFATEDILLLTVSKTVNTYTSRFAYERTNIIAYDVRNRSTHELLLKTRGLHAIQSKTRVFGVNRKRQEVYMSAFDDHEIPSLNLYRVDLTSGKGVLIKHGTAHTVDWFVSESGDVLAREDFDDKDGEHRFYSYLDGDATEILSYPASGLELEAAAVSVDEKALLFVDNSDRSAIKRLELTNGERNQVVYESGGQDIGRLVTDMHRKLVAVKYDGLQPRYEFTDPTKTALLKQVTAHFPQDSVDLVSFNDAHDQWMLQIAGNSSAGGFWLFETGSGNLSLIKDQYAGISREDLSRVAGFTYQARDGLRIPAILTLPHARYLGDGKPSQLPLVVMPHGGPAAHDTLRFDWISQALADQGYMVFQPNFRGSTGFGEDFYQSGVGRWGKEMQNDITDGVQYLIDRGLADPARVCIVGSSYGGYAALAGAAYTPDLYRCAVSINGIGDINEHIDKTLRRYQDWRAVKNVWLNVFGKETEDGERELDRDALEAVSPLYAAKRFKAPTLLIYSKQDTVVDPDQTRDMASALEKAGKPAELKVLTAEDHWLSRGESRVELMQAVSGFLQRESPAI